MVLQKIAPFKRRGLHAVMAPAACQQFAHEHAERIQAIVAKRTALHVSFAEIQTLGCGKCRGSPRLKADSVDASRFCRALDMAQQCAGCALAQTSLCGTHGFEFTMLRAELLERAAA